MFLKSFINLLFIYLFGCVGSWSWHLGYSVFIAACRIFFFLVATWTIYIFFKLQHAGCLVVACKLLIVACGVLGIKPGTPALGACNLSRLTTREVVIISRLWKMPSSRQIWYRKPLLVFRAAFLKVFLVTVTRKSSCASLTLLHSFSWKKDFRGSEPGSHCGDRASALNILRTQRVGLSEECVSNMSH